MQLLNQCLLYANLAADMAVILRLVGARLARSYRLLLAYVVADASAAVFGLALAKSRNWYAVMYFVVQTAKVFLALLIALDLFWVAFEDHPALARFGQKLLAGAVALAFIVSAMALLIDPAVPRGQSPAVHYFLAFERTIDTVVWVFLLLVGLFLAWYPVRLPRNVAVYLCGFGVLFSTHAAGLLLLNLWPQFLDQWTTFLLSSGLISLSGMAIFLRRRENDGTTVTGHRWNREATESLVEQLQSINRRLERLSR